jgi:hypothetical protein
MRAMLPAVTENLKQETVEHFRPIVEGCGAHIVDANLEVHDFVTVEFRSERIPIGYQSLHDRTGNSLLFFFAHFDEIKRVESALAEIPAPFHSDLRAAVNAQFGPAADFNAAHVITSYLSHRVHESGRRVWT